MNTTTQELEMTTRQKAPLAITSINDLTYHINSDTMVHGYCTIVYSKWSQDRLPLFDVYCQIDGGDEVLVGRDLANADATALVNYANTATFNGEEI
jgi:hypothetical protein